MSRTIPLLSESILVVCSIDYSLTPISNKKIYYMADKKMINDVILKFLHSLSQTNTLDVSQEKLILPIHLIEFLFGMGAHIHTDLWSKIKKDTDKFLSMLKEVVSIYL